MANVKPFAALRYDFNKAGAPETVCCPPYDIIPDAALWTRKNPYNALLLEGGGVLDPSLRDGAADPYEHAKFLLDAWLKSGILREDGKPAFYRYEASFISRDGTTRILRGLAALLELTPFSDGIVLPHEFTLSAAKEDRRRLMLETGCQFSPVYGLYDDPEGRIAELLDTAPPDDGPFTIDGVTHSLRALTDPSANAQISRLFEDKKIFIADGHHRYETLLRLREDPQSVKTGAPQYAMVFLAELNDPGVEMWETHRVLRSLEAYDEGRLRRLLEKSFTLTPDDTAAEGTFAWLTGSGSFRLTPKSPWAEKSSVEALHKTILEPLLGIDAENMSRGKNLTYTRDPDEAVRLVHSGEAQCAFLLPPPRLCELRDTVLAGERMPQKSTYFFPKIITGLFMYRFATWL